ncbi:MAG: hypothetical protein U9Q21_03335 [Candidatus Auribacterota bacterium]|nr:hypothetical protein [Candidatus Auribacterota bacterium]
MSRFKGVSSTFYNSFLINRSRFVRPVLLGVLLLSLVIGAGYRIIDVKENFDINNGFEYFVNMASHFWTSPGGYNFENSLKMKENPDDYVFSRYPVEVVTRSFPNEKGWAFILSVIFEEGTKGVQNLAMTVVRYQLMLDLLVIVFLFLAGRAIAGPLGGSFAAILYALFKPSIMMMSWVSYYYWAIPFSVLSLFFWTTIYKPGNKPYSLRILFLLFFLYGMIMGFATSLRLGFLFLPLFLSPLIFFRERNLKRGLILMLAMLIGQGVLLVPQILVTHKYYAEYTLSVRGKWHSVIQGLGAYPNPFGIEDTADLTAVNWAVSKGGPDPNKVGIQEYDKFMKKEAILLFKERPDIFLRNFRTNLYAGITMTPKDSTRYIGGPVFFGILDSDEKYVGYDPKILKLARFFPWLILFSICILFFFNRRCFRLFLAVIFQGLYVLGILCIYFPPVDNHTTVYFPIFVLLLAVGLAVLVKGAVSILEGFVRYWLGVGKNGYWPAAVKKCFKEDWDQEYYPASGGKTENRYI